jgi:hypothetical protein
MLHFLQNTPPDWFEMNSRAISIIAIEHIGTETNLRKPTPPKPRLNFLRRNTPFVEQVLFSESCRGKLAS